MPVRPISSTTSFPLSPQPLPPEKRELAAATAWISRQATPASARDASTASRHNWVTDLPSNLPQGCMPTPMTATSLIETYRSYSVPLVALQRPEFPRHHVAPISVDVQPLKDELDLHARPDALRFGRADPRQDAQPFRQIDDAHHIHRVRLFLLS